MPTSTPPYQYIILGAGRQGTAAASDLARFGEAEKITLADLSFETAQNSTQRVNQLVNQAVVQPLQLDVTDISALETAL